MKILLHSSKTMKPELSAAHVLTTPQFVKQASDINSLLQTMNTTHLESLMGISNKIAVNVKRNIDSWNTKDAGSPAVLTFRGDIYSGLSAIKWDKQDAAFAHANLLILSGLYGLLKPYDAIKPYRLEMGYKLKLDKDLNLDKYWAKEMTSAINPNDIYVNLTSEEYFKVVRARLSKSDVLTPRFLTVSDKTNQPTFVTVHTKIARGSFANWLVKNKVEDANKIVNYDLLNYKYDKQLSTREEPVFVCKNFGGIGLSVRLK
jgi:cytoplasmic iron level regulating protein YaaA (DUF328/UPF0246 family)